MSIYTPDKYYPSTDTKCTVVSISNYYGGTCILLQW